jgi:hypothetical protein
MCIAIICEKTTPDEKMLIEAERQNPDGAGIAWVETGAVRYLKGLTAKEVAKEIRGLPLPLFIHFRIATVAGKIASLCHPFAVRRDGKNALEGKTSYVLMHNGHWSGWKEALTMSVLGGNRQLARGPWSDTRAMAYLAAHHGFPILELITSDRIAVMNGKGEVFTYGYWHEKGGIKFSNYGLFSVPAPSHPYYGTQTNHPMGMSKKQRKEADKIAKRVQAGNDVRVLGTGRAIPVNERTVEQNAHLSFCSLSVFNCYQCCIIFGREYKPLHALPKPLESTPGVHVFSKCPLPAEKCPSCQTHLAAFGNTPGPQTMAEALEEMNAEAQGMLNKAGME